MDGSRRDADLQRPTNGLVAQTYSQLWHIVTHPAFRLGFLDAQQQRPLDHDKISDRIFAETPAGSLKRIGFASRDIFRQREVEIAQYRYEEGRLAVIQEGLRCKAWGHPDSPPAAVREYIRKRSEADTRQRATTLSAQAPVVSQRRGLPLFDAQRRAAT